MKNKIFKKKQVLSSENILDIYNPKAIVTMFYCKDVKYARCV